jgi:hypothetical protein
MNRIGFRRRLVAASMLLIAGAAAVLAQQPGPAEPQLNQKGKDVQWVPTPPALIDKMLDLAQVTPADYLVDLGSGDGVTVIAAAKRGVRALGIEYDANLVEVSRVNAQQAGVTALTKFVKADIFKTDFSKATVVTTFLLPSLNLQLRPTILAMKPGTRVVSNTFPMGEWEPDDTASVEACERWCKALLWIVPARVGGTWRTSKGELTLTQRFQMVSGSLDSTPIAEGRLRGDEVRFTVGGAIYTGRVNGYRMRGTLTAGDKAEPWDAVRR